MAVGGEGRGITRPARSRRQGRPGKPLAPVKRPALRGGTGGSQSGRALARPTKAGAFGLSESPGAAARAHRARASMDLDRLSTRCRAVARIERAGGELDAPTASEGKRDACGQPIRVKDRSLTTVQPVNLKR